MNLDVVIASPGLPHHGGTLKERSLGGSETAAIHVARCLAARGHTVTVFSQGGDGNVHDGVAYLPIEQFLPYINATPTDVCVVSRAIDSLRVRFNSKITCVWLHDLGLKRNTQMLCGSVWAVDAVYVLSEFHRKQVRETLGLPDPCFVTTRNGVDLSAFNGLEATPRDPWKLVYGSRPERGLENALAIMDILRKRGRPWHLVVAGYENYPPQMADFYNALWQRASQMPNVRLAGPLKQADWHRELASARAWIYPGVASEFAEISCIAAMEAMACGTPSVAVARGALPETLHMACAHLVNCEEDQTHSDTYRNAFCDALETLENDTLWRSMSFAARQRATTLDWSGVAEQWEAHWLGILQQRQSDPYRVKQHLARSGDRELGAIR